MLFYEIWQLYENKILYYVPITDNSVVIAVSVASTASFSTFGEQDSMDVIEKPIGLYLKS